MRMLNQLLKVQRPEQFVLTFGKPSGDCIQVIHILMERRRGFRQGVLAAHVNPQKAFSSVHHEALCHLLGLLVIAVRTIDLLPVLLF